MSRSNRVLAALGAITLAIPAAAYAQSGIGGVGQETAIDCGDGGAHVSGTDNRIAVRGPCAALRVEGTGNTVTVEVTDAAKITVNGVDNVIRWSGSARAKPRVSDSGVSNRVMRAR